jgi:hypothetical protein
MTDGVTQAAEHGAREPATGQPQAPYTREPAAPEVEGVAAAIPRFLARGSHDGLSALRRFAPAQRHQAILGLQHGAGNRAVTRLLCQDPKRRSAPIPEPHLLRRRLASPSEVTGRSAPAADRPPGGVSNPERPAASSSLAAQSPHLMRTPLVEFSNWGTERGSLELTAWPRIPNNLLRVSAIGQVNLNGRLTTVEFDRLNGVIDVQPGTQGRIKIYMNVEFVVDNEGDDNDVRNPRGSPMWVSRTWEYGFRDGRIFFTPTGPGVEHGGMVLGGPSPAGSQSTDIADGVVLQLILTGVSRTGSSRSTTVTGVVGGPNASGEITQTQTPAVPNSPPFSLSRDFTLRTRIVDAAPAPQPTPPSPSLPGPSSPSSLPTSPGP